MNRFDVDKGSMNSFTPQNNNHMNRSLGSDVDKSNIQDDDDDDEDGDQAIGNSSGDKYGAINIVTPLDEFGRESKQGYQEPKTTR
jgi:hypothetical protein